MSSSNSPRRRKHSKLFDAEREMHHSACPRTGKLRFGNRKRALTALNALLASGATIRGDNPPKRVYKCPYCKDWHLTRRPV